MAALVLVERDTLARFHGIDSADCAKGCAGLHDDAWIPWLGEGGWRGCPSVLVRDPAFQMALRTYNLKQVAPLSGWPQRFAAWVQDGMMAIEDALATKRLKAMERK
jgi:hypothetical protein